VAANDRIMGIPELDQPLALAMPPGWLALLTGTSGSGTPILAKQFAHAGVGNTPVLFYTTYERTLDVQKAFEDYGWDPSAVKIVNLADEYFERVLVHGLEVAQARERGVTLDQLTADTPHDRNPSRYSLTSRMLADLAVIDTPFRLVLDSADFFFEVLQASDVTTIVRQIKYRCQAVGGQALVSVHSRTRDRPTIAALEDLSDLVFELRAEPRGTRYEHTLFVEKVRNRPDLQRIAPAVMTETGWRIEEPPGAPG
jgi:KaiC/GvpD/RAD55 family RecA-like ATPase